MQPSVISPSRIESEREQPTGDSRRKEDTPISEENKALVLRFVENFWNAGDTAAADELMASDAAIYTA